jgi:hypothetical protein
MEKTTVTIEIKQEVSITLLWIAGGVIAVSSAFLLAPQSAELWPAANLAGVIAGVYLVALLLYALRKPLSAKLRILVGMVALVAMACTAFTWMRMEDQTRWQADEVMRIRAVVGRGIRIHEMPQPLLKTLDVYHNQGPRKKETLADVFRRIHDGATTGSNIYKPQWEGDTMTMIVETLEPDRVVLVSQETYVRGRDPGFKNYNGQKGMVQEKFILTERGISHVSEN